MAYMLGVLVLDCQRRRWTHVQPVTLSEQASNTVVMEWVEKEDREAWL